MNRMYEILWETERKYPLYTLYQVTGRKQKKKSLIFFNEQIQKYHMRNTLEQNIQLFFNNKHPHILLMTDCIIYDRAQEHIFQYFGTNLQSYITENKDLQPLKQEQILDILKQIILAVDEVMEKNFFPQNLRPEHFVRVGEKWKIRCIILNQNQNNKKNLESEYQWNQKYCPPQVLQPNHKRNISSEIVWGIGIICLLLMQNGFQISTQEQIKQICKRNFDYYSLKLGNILKGSLNPNPSQRLKLNSLRKILLSEGPQVQFNQPQKNLQRNYLKNSNLLWSLDSSIVDLPQKSLKSRSKRQSQFQNNPTNQSGIFIKGSALILESLQLNSGKTQQQGKYQIQEYDKMSLNTRQFPKKHQQKIVSKQQNNNFVKKKQRTHSIDRENQNYLSLYQQVENSDLLEIQKQLLKETLCSYRQQRQMHQFVFRLRQGIWSFNFVSEYRTYALLAECIFGLVAIKTSEVTLQQLRKTQIQLKMNDFQIFKKPKYFQNLKSIFTSSTQRYELTFKNRVQQLELLLELDLSKSQIKEFCNPLIQLCRKNNQQKKRLNQVLMMEEIRVLVYTLYDKLQKQFMKSNNNNDINCLTFMIKLLVFLNLQDLKKQKIKKVVFVDFFKKISLGNQKHFYMLQYLSFLDNCEDIQVLKKHKQTIENNVPIKIKL